MSLRPFTLDDVDETNRLHREVWWPERSRAGWEWLSRNPATLEIGSPIGLVIDDAEGRALAFLGSFTQRFWQGDAVHHAATGFSIIVPPSLRGGSRQLIPAFLGLPGLDAHYTLNCNELSSPIYKRFGLHPWPPKTHDVKLSWVIRPLTCATARGLRTLTSYRPDMVHDLGERLLPRNPVLDLALLPEDVEPVIDLTPGGDYDRYWQALKAEGRFIADRSPQMLEWRLADPDLTQPIFMIAALKQGRIVAHAMAMMVKYSSLEPATLEILDLDGLEAGRDRIAALVRSLILLAGPLGAAKLRLQVTSERLLRDLGDLALKARHEGGYGHCHIRMAAGFTGHETWEPTPFDGDYSICWRPLPTGVGQKQKRAA